MSQIRVSLALIALASLQLACDPIYGINRMTRLPSLPELDCVEQAIRSVPRVTGVRRWEAEGGRPLTLTGIKSPDHIYYFSYETGAAGAIIYFSEKYDGNVEYSQHLIRLHEHVPQEDIDEVRPIMIQVEAALEHQCGISQLPQKIEEYCSGATCE